MALVSMKEMLAKAKKRHYAVGAFNVYNLESIEAVMEAAEEKNSPVILAFAEIMKSAANIDYLGLVGKKAAEAASVPVALHLDHGKSYEYCITALRHGFSSVMIDASLKTLEENIKITKKVVEACKHLGISVEAELGHVGEGSTYGDDSDDSYKTVPEEAERFVTETDVDALAVSIGNAHGLYKKTPKIDHKRLMKLSRLAAVPLVLHGGSGISDTVFRRVVKEGICKINIFTEMSEQAIANVKRLTKSGKYNWIIEFNSTIKAGMKKVARKRMEVFGSAGKA
jgi:fructose-bisphosphate aldolase class II